MFGKKDDRLEVPNDADIEIMESFSLQRSDLRNFGIKKDPTKDYRFVSSKLVEKRKAVGYTLVLGNSLTADGTYKLDESVLMARPMRLKEASDRYKRMRTIEQTSASKESFDQEMETLSRKYDMDLHKQIGSREE